MEMKTNHLYPDSEGDFLPSAQFSVGVGKNHGSLWRPLGHLILARPALLAGGGKSCFILSPWLIFIYSLPLLQYYILRIRCT